MKRSAWLAIVFLCAMFGTAQAIMISDVTLVGQGRSSTGGSTPALFGADPFKDTIRSGFDTKGADVSASGSTLTLELITEHGGVTDGLADVFFNVGSGFNFAIEMGAIDGGGDWVFAGQQLSNVTARTSFDLFETDSSERLYGEVWEEGTPNTSPLASIRTGVLGPGTTSFSRSFDGSLWTYSLAFDYQSFLGVTNLDDVDILWATSTAGDDLFRSSDTAPVPEPATLLLMLIGLTGAGFTSIRSKLRR